jgi:hypothetical protein
MNKKTKEEPSIKWRSIDEAPEYLASIIEMGMAAQLSPLSSDPPSTKTEQSSSTTSASKKD